MSSNEIWIPIKNYENSYEISNKGKIRSLDRVIIRSDARTSRRKGGVLKPCKVKCGYFMIQLGRRNYYYLYRLIAMHFVSKKEDQNFVNHLDGNKLNNDLNNLEWCTQAENNRHANATGLSAKGESIAGAILNPAIVIKIRNLYDTGKHSQSALGRMFNCAQPTILNVVNKRTWKHVK